MRVGSIGEAEGDASVTQGRGQLPSPGIIGVDHRRLVSRRKGEELFFGGEVIFHGMVIIQVFPAQVGEDSDGEGDPGDPVQFQGVGRNLHHAVRGPVLQHPFQHGLDVRSLGGGAHRFHLQSRPPVRDGPDHAGVVSRRLKDALQQVGDGGFSLGSGYSHHLEPAGGAAEEEVGDQGQGTACLFHLDPGSLKILRSRPLGKNGDRSPGPCLRHEGGPVLLFSLQCREQVSGADVPGGIGDPPDLDIRRPGDPVSGKGVEQGGKLHLFSNSLVVEAIKISGRVSSGGTFR